MIIRLQWRAAEGPAVDARRPAPPVVDQASRIKNLRLAPALAVLLTGMLGSTAAAQAPNFELELEAGPVWQTRNDVEIPNDGSATRFALSDVVGSGPWATARVYLTWHVSERHAVRILYAPLSVTETGRPTEPLSFAGASYLGNTPVQATYTFNSYRATYRWRFHSGDRSAVWVGFTAKVRDASIALAQGATTSRKDDLGFVPLLHLSAERTLSQRWRVSLDADALAGGPGRAIDAALRLGYDLGDRWSLRAGYRTVEGGADVASVYNFAWLHYASASIVLRL